MLLPCSCGTRVMSGKHHSSSLTQRRRFGEARSDSTSVCGCDQLEQLGPYVFRVIVPSVAKAVPTERRVLLAEASRSALEDGVSMNEPRDYISSKDVLYYGRCTMVPSTGAFLRHSAATTYHRRPQRRMPAQRLASQQRRVRQPPP